LKTSPSESIANNTLEVGEKSLSPGKTISSKKKSVVTKSTPTKSTPPKQPNTSLDRALERALALKKIGYKFYVVKVRGVEYLVRMTDDKKNQNSLAKVKQRSNPKRSKMIRSFIHSNIRSGEARVHASRENKNAVWVKSKESEVEQIH